MDGFIEFLSAMPFWYWWVLAAILLTIELMTGTTYFLWPAVSAVLVGFFDIWPFQDAWQIQLILFSGFTVALSVFAPPHVKPWLQKTREDHFTLNQRGTQKIGKLATVDAAFENGVGKVRLGDTLWLAESVDGQNFDEGAQVEITQSEGTKLFVKAAG